MNPRDSSPPMKVVVARRFSNASVAHRASEAIAIYPITPSFTMASR